MLLVYDRSEAITSVQGRVAEIKPKGTFVPRRYPSVIVTVERGGAVQTLTLTPVIGAYDKVSPAQADALAGEFASRLGAGQAGAPTA